MGKIPSLYNTMQHKILPYKLILKRIFYLYLLYINDKETLEANPMRINILTKSKCCRLLDVTFLMSSSDSPFTTLLTLGAEDSAPVPPGPELA